MPQVDIGDILPFRFEVRDALGVLTNASTCTIVVTDPDGITTAPAVANPTVGVYQVDATAAFEGVWSARALTTGPQSVSPPQSFYVGSGRQAVTYLSLAEAKQHLRVTNTTQDSLIQSKLMAACRMVEEHTNRNWIWDSLDEVYDGGRSEIILRSGPVKEIVEVTENGTLLSVDDYFLRDDSYILVRGTPQGPTTWVQGTNNILVSYTVSSGAIPHPVREATLIVLGDLWRTQRGGSDVFDEQPYPNWQAMLAPYCRPGIA